MPRKPKDPALVKGKVATIRFTDEQWAQIQSAADHEERLISDWLRRLALKEASRVNERASKKASRAGS